LFNQPTGLIEAWRGTFLAANLLAFASTRLVDDPATKWSPAEMAATIKSSVAFDFVSFVLLAIAFVCAFRIMPKLDDDVMATTTPTPLAMPDIFKGTITFPVQH
jgi:hypothetical protein